MIIKLGCNPVRVQYRAGPIPFGFISVLVQFRGLNSVGSISWVQISGFNSLGSIFWVQFRWFNFLGSISWARLRGLNAMGVIPMGAIPLVSIPLGYCIISRMADLSCAKIWKCVSKSALITFSVMKMTELFCSVMKVLNRKRNTNIVLL